MNFFHMAWIFIIPSKGFVSRVSLIFTSNDGLVIQSKYVILGLLGAIYTMKCLQENGFNNLDSNTLEKLYSKDLIIQKGYNKHQLPPVPADIYGRNSGGTGLLINISLNLNSILAINEPSQVIFAHIIEIFFWKHINFQVLICFIIDKTLFSGNKP